jgi:probable HAF family extracellular repeat protein
MKHLAKPAAWLWRPAGALAIILAAGGGALGALPAHAATTRPAAATSYAFTTLDNDADPTFNQLLGINSSDLISGYFGSGLAGHPNQGYTLASPYGQSDYTSENFPGSVQTQVTGLNNLGDTTGFWVDAAGNNHGFVEWNGAFTSYNDPNTPKIKGRVNQLLGINNKGIAVGFYNDAEGNAHAYTLNQATGKFTALAQTGVSNTASAINDNGDIVGYTTSKSGVTYSFLLVDGTRTALQFPGGSDTEAFGINDKNQIVGSYLDASGVMHGFVLSDPTGPHSVWQSIDDPNGVGSTVINGINDAGDLVGFYTDSSGNTDGMLATP